MKAYFKYALEDHANHPETQTDYVAHAKALVDDAVWNNILTDEVVIQAHTDWAATAAACTDYGGVTYLLNRVSYAYYTHAALETDEVVLYTSPHDQPPHGDYLGAASKADWVALMARSEVLKTVLSGGPFPPTTQCPRYMGFGEGKPTPESRQGQFLWYLSSLKRYRPDIATVHGFKLEGKKLFLASLNPCGVRFSETSDCGELAFWIAHIVLLYDAYLTRDRTLSLLPRAADEYVRWNLATAQGEGVPQETITAVPFKSTHCPGRMTWLALQLGEKPQEFATFYREPASGFLKISWQDVTSVFDERQLLDIAHGIAPPPRAERVNEVDDTAPGTEGDLKGQEGDAATTRADAGGPRPAVDAPIALDQVDWLPGLARHWPNSCHRDSKELAIDGVVDGKEIRRVKEVLHLASLGRPLSQCERPSHLISVICDAIGTHRQMLKRKLIHRDVSWFNLLCKPWHHPRTGDKLPDDYPSVGFILTGTEAPPCSMLVDLDHGAIVSTLYSDTYLPRLQRTGTPMFISLELSATMPREYTILWSDLEALVTKLQSIEERVKIFNRAFPDDDGRFMRDLWDVLDKEKARGGRSVTNPKTPHLPRHDIESFYWIMLWAFSRACPKGSDPSGEDIPEEILDEYSQFVNSMLGHKPRHESQRVHYLFALWNCEKLLHPRLSLRFATLLKDMATYLSVPWHIYDDDLLPDHAHIAMQRLLILELDDLLRDAAGNDPNSKDDDLAFDTLQPRIAQVIESAVLARSMQHTCMGLMSAVEAAAYLDVQDRTVRTQLARGVKRKPEDAPLANDSVFTAAQLKRARTKLAENAAEDRAPSAADLVRMIFDDRLWFGTGSRVDQAAADANADQ